MASPRRLRREDEMMLEVEQAHAAAASGKPRRVFFESMRKHGLTACESSNNQAACAERTAPLRITSSRLSRYDRNPERSQIRRATGSPRSLPCLHIEWTWQCALSGFAKDMLRVYIGVEVILLEEAR